MISESGVCYLISLERYLSSMCSLFLVFIEVIASFFRWYRAFVPVVTVRSIVYRLVEMFLTSVVILKLFLGRVSHPFHVSVWSHAEPVELSGGLILCWPLSITQNPCLFSKIFQEGYDCVRDQQFGIHKCSSYFLVQHRSPLSMMKRGADNTDFLAAFARRDPCQKERRWVLGLSWVWITCTWYWCCFDVSCILCNSSFVSDHIKTSARKRSPTRTWSYFVRVRRTLFEFVKVPQGYHVEQHACIHSKWLNEYVFTCSIVVFYKL